MNFDTNKLKFDENGLIPAIVTDQKTGKVLTLAYMNRESLAITLEKELTCFYSRSRQCLWLKGETSGNYQHVKKITTDCDMDALLIEAEKDGPACHTGTDSCFTNEVFASEDHREPFALESLYSLLLSRKEEMPPNSYTTYLFEKGLDKILKKIGEEATEVIIGAKNDRAEVLYEIADLAYHVMVLMVEAGISLEDIHTELASRHVIDHKVKQEKMK